MKCYRIFEMILNNTEVNVSSQNNLACKSYKICDKYEVSLVKYSIDDQYARSVRKRLKDVFPVQDGFNDTVRQLLLSNDPYDKTVLHMMIMPF